MAKLVNKKSIVLSLLFLISAIIFLLLFSWSTSFLFDYKTTDSAIFQTIGKFSNKNMSFYKGLFDHKGPIMFLIEKIGYAILNDKTGVFLVQIPFWFATLCGTYKIIRQFFKTNLSVVLTECSLLLYVLFYSGVGGNCSEEYMLPFLVWSLYFTLLFVKDFQNEKNQCEHKPQYALFYGTSFAVGAFTRLTNALPICISVLVILCLLLYKKRWKNILYNALCLIAGVAIITLPIIIWFTAHGTFKDMIDATFIANIKYSKVHRYKYSTIDLIKFFARYRVVLLCGLALGLIGIRNKKSRLISVLCVSHLIGSIVIDISTPMFYYYAMIWVPTLILVLCATYYCKWGKIIARIITIGVIVFIAVNGAKSFNDCRLAKEDIRLSMIKKEIPKKHHDKVIAYNTSPHFYLETDIPPCYRNFVLQDFHSSFNEKTKKQFDKDIKSLKAEYIIEENNKEKNKWDTFIDKNYTITKKTKWFLLKKKNNIIRD